MNEEKFAIDKICTDVKFCKSSHKFLFREFQQFCGKLINEGLTFAKYYTRLALFVAPGSIFMQIDDYHFHQNPSEATNQSVGCDIQTQVRNC